MLSSKHQHLTKKLSPTPDDSLPPQEGEGEGPGERVLQPMKWGLVPSWMGEQQRPSSSSPAPRPLLNNCRLEGILEKPSFRNAVAKRRRCVVLADG